MSIANLTKYQPAISRRRHNDEDDEAVMRVSNSGGYVKFEEAISFLASFKRGKISAFSCCRLFEEASISRAGMLYSEQCIIQAEAKLSAI